MRTLLATALFALAGAAAAQPAAPAPSAAQPPERATPAGEAGLNLRLDEPGKSRSRIMFGPRFPAAEPGAGDAASSLPSLGEPPKGSPAPARGQLDKRPYPQDMTPGI